MGNDEYTEVQPRERWYKRLAHVLTSWPVRLVGTCICLWLLFRNINVADALRVLAHADLKLVVICLFATVFVLAFSMGEWAVLVRCAVPVSWSKLIYAFTKSLAPAYILPTGLGGDAVKIFDLSAETGTACATAASLVARLGSTSAMMVWALLGSFELDGTIRFWAIGASAVSVLAMVLLWVVTLLPSAAAIQLASWTKRLSPKISRAIIQFASELKCLGAKPQTLACSFCISMLGWGVQNLCLSVLALSVGLEVPWYLFATAVPFSLIATLAPFALNGYGLREGILVALLMHAGLTATNSAAVALLVDLQLAPFILISALMWLDTSQKGGLLKASNQS